MADTLLVIPTYNERDNVERLHAQIQALNLDLDVLFVDDNSPDGTGEVLDRLASTDPRLRVIHRASKQGVGTAHLEGIRCAYDRGYRTLLTMDCDFTHEPERIPEFLAAADEADLVVGSRFAHPKGVAEWNVLRKLLTNTGHLLTKRMLRVPYDATGAYRLYRLDRIDRAVFDLVTSRSYSFFFETMYLFVRCGVRIREVPISLPRRTYGHSKMTVRDVLTSVQMLVALYIRSFRQAGTFRLYRERRDIMRAAEGVEAERA